MGLRAGFPHRTHYLVRGQGKWAKWLIVLRKFDVTGWARGMGIGIILLDMTSRIEKVETEIMQMSAEELAAFRDWFVEV